MKCLIRQLYIAQIYLLRYQRMDRRNRPWDLPNKEIYHHMLLFINSIKPKVQVIRQPSCILNVLAAYPFHHFKNSAVSIHLKIFIFHSILSVHQHFNMSKRQLIYEICLLRMQQMQRLLEAAFCLELQ